MQAGGSNDSVNVRMPAGITRLFKSDLDWNLYTNRQQGVNDRRVSPSRAGSAASPDHGCSSNFDHVTMPTCL